jgi:hypothetical protein
MPLVVGEALSVLWQEPPVSIECTASCGKKTSALDHLPESVAGAAVFDPMHTRGFDVIRWSIKGGASIPHCTSGTIWQVRLKRHPGDSDVIRWSMKGGASIPPCTSGTIFRSG